MNIFELAARERFRFDSIRGDLTVEHLWDLPLKSTSGFDLDTTAKAVNAALKNSRDESFVDVKTDKASAMLEAKLEIVKFIIADKQAAAAAVKKRVENRQRRQKLLEALERKDNASLEAKTSEELLQELEKLDEMA